VALLHSFTYEESAAFRDAAAKDLHCAMPHGGLAMTEYQQVWEPYAGPAELRRGAAEIRKDGTYDALRLLKIAADHEDAAEKHSVTPGAVRPAWELLGDLLMEMHEPKEALIAYRQVLSVATGRRNAMKEAAEAERIASMSRLR